ncbi:phosphomannomutase/phosphoglucomutase [Dermabacteraceae bacterium CCM 9519]
MAAISHPPFDTVVKAYDVRGREHVDLTVDMVRALAAALVDETGEKEIVVGHDMRVSSPEFADAFAQGAMLRGAHVLELGLCSTDGLYCASGIHSAAGAMITASHNPAGDNGMKFCRSGARPISRETGLAAMQERAEAYLAAGEIPEVPGGSREKVDLLGEYTERVVSLVPFARRRPLKIVVDAANAMAGFTMPAVAKQLPGIEIVPLYFELDGTFPNHEANPLDPENLRDLEAAVQREGADLGLAFDGDADRCFVVDERGQAVSASAITALIATREIARTRAEGETQPAIVANVVSSRHVKDAIDASGGKYVRSKVGHSLIKGLMARENAVFGGEHSAHYYFRDFFFADSGMLAALHVVAALSETDGTLSQLVGEHQPYAASGEINRRVTSVADATEAVVAEFSAGSESDRLDGVSVVHWEGYETADQWWFSLRPSNTEPMLRLNVEAVDPETMARVRDRALEIIGKFAA